MPDFVEIKRLLSSKTVGIAGAGGLGSNCASSLLRAGVGKLIIADFDVVSEANLNRQFFFYDQIGEKKVIALSNNLLKINPKACIQVHDTKVTSSNIGLLFSTCDVVVEAFDDSAQKKILIETMLLMYPYMPLVIGSGMAGWGDSNSLKVEKLGNVYICGDTASEVSDICPPIAPRVCIVANMQANSVLEVLLKEINNEDNSK